MQKASNGKTNTFQLMSVASRARKKLKLDFVNQTENKFNPKTERD